MAQVALYSSATMEKCGPGPAANARARRLTCWQSVFAGQHINGDLPRYGARQRAQMEHKVPVVQDSSMPEAKNLDAQETPCSQHQCAASATSVTLCSTTRSPLAARRVVGFLRQLRQGAQAGLSDAGGRCGSSRRHSARREGLRRRGMGMVARQVQGGGGRCGCQAVDGGRRARWLWSMVGRTRRKTCMEAMDVPTAGAVQQVDVVEQGALAPPV